MQKILFVGNSYTYYNDMPTALFVPKAEAAGFPCQVTAVTRGGWTLAKFADPNDEEGARLRSVVEGQQYDWVILQEQSCRPVVNQDAFFRGVEDLKILLAPQTDRFLLYATWGRKPGSEKLEERMCIRPTSETLFCEHFKDVIHSWRDLTKLYNQWCSVLRWEKTSRPFLRHREFL